MQLQPLYRPILKKALSIVWRHKFLWFFGFFAALLGGGGEIDILVGGAKNINWGAGFSDIFGQIFKNKGLAGFLGDLGLRLSQLPMVGIVILITLLLGVVVLIWLFIASQITLIDTTAKIEKNEATSAKIRHLAVKEYFWKILGINVINKVIIFGLLLLLGLPIILLTNTNAPSSLILMIISYIILVPLAIIVSFVLRYASCYIILSQKRIGEAILKGFGLFLTNWMISIEMAILFFALNIAVGLLMLLIVLIMAFPFMVGAEIFIDIGSGGGSWTVITIGLILALGVLALFGSLFVSFNYAGWTLLFSKLNGKEKQLSRLVRWVAGVGKR